MQEEKKGEEGKKRQEEKEEKEGQEGKEGKKRQEEKEGKKRQEEQEGEEGQRASKGREQGKETRAETSKGSKQGSKGSDGMRSEYTLELWENTSDKGDKLVIKPYRQEDMGLHGHHFFELVYITSGSAEHTLNGMTGMVREGNYFIVDYGSVHSYQKSQGLTLLNCLFLPEIIDNTLSGCKSFESLLRVCLLRYYKQYYGTIPANHVFFDEDGKIRNLLAGMQEEYEEKHTGYTEIFRCRLLEILIHTMRKTVKEEHIRVMGRTKSTVVLQAIQYLEEHYQEHRILEGFCKEYHYSLQYVSRRFREETGFTALSYLQKFRIEKSCELLAGSGRPIQDIAREVGYEDMKYFHQVFRKLVQMSPGEYRKMQL